MDLGILDAIEQEDIDKLEENINNSEVIMEIVSADLHEFKFIS